MSVTSLKLNMPGIGSSFGGSGGISQQVSVNLSNSSSASRTTGFSLSPKTRYNWTPGQKVTTDTSKYNYQGVRYRANGGGQVRNSGFYGAGSTRIRDNVNYKVDNGSAYNTGMAIAQTAVGVLGMLNKMGVFGGKKAEGAVAASNTNSNKLSAAMSGLGPGNTAITLSSASAGAALSAMSNADNSADLTGAISTAKQTLSNMDAVANGNNFKLNYDKAKDAKADLKADVDSKEKAVSQKKQDVTTAKNTVEAHTSKRNQAKAQLNKLDANYGKAVNNYTAAHDKHVDAQNAHKTASNTYSLAQKATSDAQAVLDNTPETIKTTNPDGSVSEIPNPEYKAAKAKLETAKANEEKAKEALDAAEKTEQETAKAEAEALEQKQKAHDALGDKKDEIDNLEKELEEAQGKLDGAKESQTKLENELQDSEFELEAAEENLQKAKDDIDKYEEYKDDREKLSNAITKQEKRLAKMIKDEDKKQAKLAKDINENSQKRDEKLDSIDLSNGADKTEKKASKKAVKLSDKVSEDMAKANRYDEIDQKREIMKKIPKTIDGQQYRSGEINGEQVYFRDTVAITKDEYEKAVGVSA